MRPVDSLLEAPAGWQFGRLAGAEQKSGGRQLSVSLSQTENGTQATIVVPKAADGGEIYDGKQHYSHPALMQPLRPAVQEMIDAAMEKRPFDWHRLPDPLNIGPNDTLTNCGMGQESLQRGIPVELSDPEGVPHDVAVKLGLSL